MTASDTFPRSFSPPWPSNFNLDMRKPTTALALFVELLCTRHAFGGFSQRTSFDGGYIQQNGEGTWCYYPLAGITEVLSCPAEYTPALDAHLEQTVAIGYYQPDGTRSGGAEWPVLAENPGLIFLCASGRVGSGTYQTWCGPVTADNTIGDNFGGVGECVVARAQNTVTDGCYVSSPSTSSTSSPTQTAQSNGKGGLSIGDTIAIVFGAVSSIGVVIALWMCLRSRG
jgi:hypothetical protein